MSPGPIRVMYLDHTAALSGAELALLRLLESLDRTRVAPMVVLAEDGPLREKLAQVGVDTHVMRLDERVRTARKDSLGLAGLLGQARSAATLWGYAQRLGRLARQHRIELIYTNSLKSDFYGGLAGRLAGIPVIWHIHDRIDEKYLPAATVRVFRFLARRLPKCVVANSAATLATLHLEGRRPSEVIAPGLSAEAIESGEGPRSTNAVPRVGILGRIAPWKGQDVFLEAAARLRGEAVPARFLVVGAAMFGSEEARFEQQLRSFVAARGLADYVDFTGFVDVPPMLKTLDVLVHASRIPEPFGQVIIEGMAAQLPVVASDAGGAREIIESGTTGVLVPPGDAQALAAAIAQLLADPQRRRRMGAAARRHVLEHFTVARSARQSEALYARLLALRA